MKIIYEPSGAAREYAPLALNLSKGCVNACEYCYCPGVLRMKKEDFFAAANPKEDALNFLVNDCQELRGDPREILLSFVGDPYQNEQMAGITKQALKILEGHGLRATILTKNPRRAVKDFYVLQRNGWRYGTSIVWTKESDRAKWEPNADRLEERTEALVMAYNMKIPTWVSLEPVIDPSQALQVIRKLHYWVDHWYIGKINHNAELEKKVDWNWFYQLAEEQLNSLGAKYTFKESLKSYGIPNSTQDSNYPDAAASIPGEQGEAAVER